MRTPFILALFFLGIAQAYASIVPIPLNQRLSEAPVFVRGQVLSKAAYQNTGQKQIYTLYEIAVYASTGLPGPAPEVIGLLSDGGTVGEQMQVTYPNFSLYPGQEVFLLLEEASPGESDEARPGLSQYRPFSSVQGVLRGAPDGAFYDIGEQARFTEADLLNRLQQHANATLARPDGQSYEPASRPEAVQERTMVTVADITTPVGDPVNGYVAGTVVADNELIITGSGFGAAPGTVLFANADNGGSGDTGPLIDSDIVSWSPTQVRVKIPSEAGTGTLRVLDSGGIEVGAAAITIQYAVLSINSTFAGYASPVRHNPRLADMNGSGGYTYLYNNDFPSMAGSFFQNAAAQASFERALDTWRLGTGVNFIRDNSGTALDAPNNEGGTSTCVVSFGNLGSGVLGRATTYYSGTANGACNLENTRWFVEELDLQFAVSPAGQAWNFGPGAPSSGEFDFETVALHELGHALGLAHVIDAAEVMHFVSFNGTQNRTLSASSMAGAAYAVARGTEDLNTTTGCGLAIPPMTLYTPPGAGSVLVSPKAMLMGSLDLSSTASPVRMRDDLRAEGRIPLLQPYTALAGIAHLGAEEITDASLLLQTGDDAIVDWVLVELRDPGSPATVLATRAALIQRDGDIVDVDGASPVAFNIIPGSYQVAIRHRNHLGVMTKSPLLLSAAPVEVDFKDPSLDVFERAASTDGAERFTFNPSTAALWAGKVSSTLAQISYAGQNNSADGVYTAIVNDSSNPGGSQSAIIPGYLRFDLNMDGAAKYSGSANEIDLIFNAIFLNPSNSSGLSTFTFREQLP